MSVLAPGPFPPAVFSPDWMRHYSHASGGAFSEVWRTIAHAAIWSVVGRIIWHAPWVAVVVMVAAAVLYLVASRRRTGGRR